MPLLSRRIADTRYAKVEPFIQGDVLELGCSSARLLKRYGSRMASYCGVERSAEAVERLQAEHPQADFFQRDLDHDRLDLGRKFDRIFMLALIEHLFNQKFVMDHVADALKPGGCVVLTTPTPLGNDLVHRTGARLGLFARDAVDDHIVLYDRHRFRLLAKEVGLELREHRYFQLFCNQIAVLEKPAG